MKFGSYNPEVSQMTKFYREKPRACGLVHLRDPNIGLGRDGARKCVGWVGRWEQIAIATLRDTPDRVLEPRCQDHCESLK